LKAGMETWRGFWRLRGYSRGVALETAAAIAATWVGIRVAGFRRWKAALARLTPRGTGAFDAKDAALMERAHRIARIHEATSRHLSSRANCLEQSLVLWWLLVRRGIRAELRIGARKEAGRFEAHAWVELGGVVLNNTGEEHLHFAPFDGSIVSMETQTH
jgi:hypothetical protein